jgi:hypothetical protein
MRRGSGEVGFLAGKWRTGLGIVEVITLHEGESFSDCPKRPSDLRIKVGKRNLIIF